MLKSSRIVVVVLLALIGLALAMNPTPEQHRNRIRAATAERSPLAAMLGAGVLTAFASNYHSVGVASYTRVNDRIISVGAFGMIFIVE
jgi:hypothetical protein